MTSRKPRDPKPPMLLNDLPARFEQAALATDITKTLEHWYRNIADALTSDAGRLVMRNELLRHLRGQGSLPVASIIGMADRGHVPAIEALRVHIGTHLDQGGRWEDLSDQLRGWGIHKMMLQPVVSGYPDGGRLLVDTWVRDIGIRALMQQTISRWPEIRQRQAAEFIAVVLRRHGFKLKAQQIERIYRSRDTVAERIGEFMLSSSGTGC
jgi:hypothetical protein